MNGKLTTGKVKSSREFCGLLVVLVFCVVFYMLFVFVLCLVSNAVCVSGLSIVDCHFGFLLTFIQITLEKVTVTLQKSVMKAGGCKD
jgi:uncharacterized membrane protein required for colicin V production